MLKIRRPFIISLFGILLSELLLMADLHALLWCAVAALSGLLLFFTIRKSAASRALLILLACSLLSLTVFTAHETVREKEKLLTGYNKEISGAVTKISRDADGNISSAVLSRCTADNRKIYSDIRIYTDGETVFSCGDLLRISADELFVSEGEGIFRFHTLSDGCRLAATCEAEDITVTKAEKSLYNSVLAFRGNAAEALRNSLSYEGFGIAQALLTGSRDNVSPELSSAFRICGCSHIFAVSGMHLSLWTGMLFIIFRRRARLSPVTNILAFVFVIFYIIFTGLSPSVLRAGIMLITVFTGRIIKRQADTLNSLGLAGTVLAAFNPYLAGNVSFILSFAATGAIALWDEYILPEKKNFRGLFRKIKNRMVKPLYDTVTTLAVMLTTLPAVSVFFGYASLLSPLASLIITPLAEAVMLLSSLIVLLPQGTLLHAAAGNITEAVCGSLSDTVTRLSQADFMIIPVKPSVLFPIFAAVSALCVLFLVFFKERKKALICILAGTLLFTGLTSADLYSHRDEAEIKIYGKENATLISVSDYKGTCAVIGSGGSFSLVSELSRDLSGRGISRADLLLIPRDTATESKNTAYLQRALLPEATVKPYELSAPVSISLREDTHIYAYTTKDFCAVAAYIKGTKIVICPYPSSVFTEAHAEFLQGDILICRSNIPEALDTGAFSDVIIVTDTYKEPLSSFISSIDRNLTITVKGDSYAVY